MTQQSPPAHHRTTLSRYIFTMKACIDNREKSLLNISISSRCPHNMANFGPLTDEIGWRVWGTPANFNGFRVLASLLQTNQTLHDVWPSPGVVGLHYIYIFGDGILSGAKFTMRPSLAFSYRPLGLLAASLHGTPTSAELCGVVQGMELTGNFRTQRASPIFAWAAITLGIGPHSSCLLFHDCSTPKLPQSI